MKTRHIIALSILMVLAAAANAAGPLDPWRSHVSISPVDGGTDRHTIHAYFNASPESPDGRRLVFYASKAPDAETGEIRIRERASGNETVIARDVTVEDAHRAACQQWISGGRQIAFHNLVAGEWLVVVADVASLKQNVVARGWQLGWGQPTADLLPLYGPHWAAGEHRDLALLNVRTGEMQTAVRADAVRAAYPAWVAKRFGNKPISIFFPILSPDLARVFFKMATPAGGEFRSSKASIRLGLVCYDLAEGRFHFLRDTWGHPAWHPDSRTIIEKGNELICSDDGAVRRIPGLPGFHGGHPTVSPDGRLFATDTTLEKFGGAEKEWGVVVGDMGGGDYVIIRRFDNSRGARSWRRSHPHPVWSADGRRIYFNVSDTAWTRLHVAEAAPSAP